MRQSELKGHKLINKHKKYLWLNKAEKIYKWRGSVLEKKTCKGFIILSTFNSKVQSSERWLESIALGVNKSLARVQKCYVHGQRVQKMIMEGRLNQLPESLFTTLCMYKDCFFCLEYLYNHPFACQCSKPFSSTCSNLNHSMNHCLWIMSN